MGRCFARLVAELSALFIGSSIVAGLIGKLSEVDITDSFINGARDLLGVALIIAIGRIGYSTWLRFIGPLLAFLTTMVMVLLSVGVMLG